MQDEDVDRGPWEGLHLDLVLEETAGRVGDGQVGAVAGERPGAGARPNPVVDHGHIDRVVTKRPEKNSNIVTCSNSSRNHHPANRNSCNHKGIETDLDSFIPLH